MIKVTKPTEEELKLISEKMKKSLENFKKHIEKHGMFDLKNIIKNKNE